MIVTCIYIMSGIITKYEMTPIRSIIAILSLTTHCKFVGSNFAALFGGLVDNDLFGRLLEAIQRSNFAPLNLEVALSSPSLAFAIKIKSFCCFSLEVIALGSPVTASFVVAGTFGKYQLEHLEYSSVGRPLLV
ncbi:hypothetical protein U1Q18_031440 [Sarracenia purpurea var. burkii]